MATITVGIIGLSRVGLSLDLALRRASARKEAAHQFEVTLADYRAGVREEVLKAKLATRVEASAFSAAQNKDIVVLGVPYADLESAYQEIAPALRPGCVVLDTAPLKQPSIRWAGQYLTKEAHLVGLTAILNPQYLFDGADDALHAQADLFDQGTFLLMPSPTCAVEAVELATDFAGIVGAKTQFLDPAEHDSLAAATEALPALLGAATFYSQFKARGWADKARLTNPAFGRLTHHLFDTHPDDLRDFFLHSRADLVRQLDTTLATLNDMRAALAQDDAYALEALLVAAAEAYDVWLNQRHSGKWDVDELPEAAPVGNVLLGGLLGGFLSKRFGGKS